MVTGRAAPRDSALRWQDVDLERGTITIRKTLIDRGGRLSFSTPKTHRSRQPVDLSDSAVMLLRQHRVKQNTERLGLGDIWRDSGLVFTSEIGTRVHPRNLFRSFRETARKANAPAIRFHDLRHTHATLLFQADVHPKVVSERLGHATIGLTLDTYSHVLPGMQRDAVNKLDAVLGRTRKTA